MQSIIKKVFPIIVEHRFSSFRFKRKISEWFVTQCEFLWMITCIVEQNNWGADKVTIELCLRLSQSRTALSCEAIIYFYFICLGNILISYAFSNRIIKATENYNIQEYCTNHQQYFICEIPSFRKKNSRWSHTDVEFVKQVYTTALFLHELSFQACLCTCIK